MKLVFPLPGGPWKRYPRRYGIPLVRYHFSVSKNSITSLYISSDNPSAKITESIARFSLGGPKGRQFTPQFLYIVVLFSFPLTSRAFASVKRPAKNWGSFPRTVKVTVSHGTPSLECCRSALSRFTVINLQPCQMKCLPTEGSNLKKLFAEFFGDSAYAAEVLVLTLKCCVRALFSRSHRMTHGYAGSRLFTSRDIQSLLRAAPRIS
mmetsp:Transcript_4321/g.6472  ORF Transcript_4321/g.6472 Transcript_4321/m.6472 type:complete len:207 (-) Transcript_4321:185-805(-)